MWVSATQKPACLPHFQATQTSYGPSTLHFLRWCAPGHDLLRPQTPAQQPLWPPEVTLVTDSFAVLCTLRSAPWVTRLYFVIPDPHPCEPTQLGLSLLHILCPCVSSHISSDFRNCCFFFSFQKCLPAAELLLLCAQVECLTEYYIHEASTLHSPRRAHLADGSAVTPALPKEGHSRNSLNTSGSRSSHLAS